MPSPEGRPTDAERHTLGLSRVSWITADMAYRRAALVETGGFDERFPRAFREDSDLALRTVRIGYGIPWGERVTTHPLAPSAVGATAAETRQATPTLPYCGPSTAAALADRYHAGGQGAWGEA